MTGVDRRVDLPDGVAALQVGPVRRSEDGVAVRVVITPPSDVVERLRLEIITPDGVVHDDYGALSTDGGDHLVVEMSVSIPPAVASVSIPPAVASDGALLPLDVDHVTLRFVLAGSDGVAELTVPLP